MGAQNVQTRLRTTALSYTLMNTTRVSVHALGILVLSDKNVRFSREIH